MRDLRLWQERLERLVDPGGQPWTRRWTSTKQPARYVVTAELPGLTREQDRAGRPGQPAHHPRRASWIGGTTRATRHYHQVERGHGGSADVRIRIEDRQGRRFGRPDQRRPDDHAAEGRTPARAEDRGSMMARRIAVSTFFMSIAFFAGLGGDRTDEERRARAPRRRVRRRLRPRA